MNKKISLLDCTLRDGGYVNDWRFGQDNLVSIFERLVDAGVDIIEIGFIDDRRPFDIDRSIMPDTSCAGKIFGGLDRKQAMVLGMIDYGTCAIENVQPCSESYLDGIRVIFKKHIRKEAMEYCRQLKSLGYKVFAQLVSVTTYSDDEMMDLIGLVNDIKPYAVSMVDTYGLMHPEDMLHIYQMLDENVNEDVKIGFHGHNNLQLAYANSVAFLDKPTKHDIVVDGTLYGMGKSAGNAPIELLAMRLNEKYDKNYSIPSMLEGIEESIFDFYASAPWGYKLFFYLCAKNRCHPNYLTFFEATQNLSATRMDELLSAIEPEDKKLLYDRRVADDLYNAYLSDSLSDESDKASLLKDFAGKKLLIVGPGKNINLQDDKVQDFIRNESPYIISINYIPKDIDMDCIFVTNKRRYHDMTLDLKKCDAKLLATTNVECRNGRFDFVVNRAPLLETDEDIIDNSFLMLVKLLKDIGVTELYCAGFDGYSDKEDNYCNPSMEYFFVKQEASHLNAHMKKKIAEFRKSMSINFITYSAYDVVEDINSAAI